MSASVAALRALGAAAPKAWGLRHALTLLLRRGALRSVARAAYLESLS
jgi:hypothetical protein